MQPGCWWMARYQNAYVPFAVERCACRVASAQWLCGSDAVRILQWWSAHCVSLAVCVGPKRLFTMRIMYGIFRFESSRSYPRVR